MRFSILTFVGNTIGNLPNVTRAEFLESDRPFCIVSITKFISFKNPFATFTSLPELTDLFC